MWVESHIQNFEESFHLILFLFSQISDIYLHTFIRLSSDPLLYLLLSFTMLCSFMFSLLSLLLTSSFLLTHSFLPSFLFSFLLFSFSPFLPCLLFLVSPFRISIASSRFQSYSYMASCSSSGSIKKMPNSWWTAYSIQAMLSSPFSVL